jgi:hypothetical protein
MRLTTLVSLFTGFDDLTGWRLRLSSMRAQGNLVAVGELAGIEVFRLLRDDLFGDLQHLGVGLGQVGQRHLVGADRTARNAEMGDCSHRGRPSIRNNLANLSEPISFT